MVLGLCVVIANSKKPQRDQRKTFRHADNADYTDPKNSLRDQREISLMDSTLCDGFDFPVNEKNIHQWAVTNADSLENWKSKTGHVEGSGFTGTVGPQQSHDLSLFYINTYTIHHGAAFIGLVNMFGAQYHSRLVKMQS